METNAILNALKEGNEESQQRVMKRVSRGK